MKTLYLALASSSIFNLFASEASKAKEFTVKAQQYVLLKGKSWNSQVISRSHESQKDKLERKQEDESFVNARGKTIAEIFGLQFVQRDEKDTFSEICIVCRNDFADKRVIKSGRIERTEWDVVEVLPLVVTYCIDKSSK